MKLIRMIATLAVLLSVAPGIAVAADAPAGVTPEMQAEHDRVIELASADQHVQDRLALRPGHYEVRAGLVDFSTAEDPLKKELGERWLVGWYRDGSTTPVLTANIDPESDGVTAQGQALVVMPDRHNAALRTHETPWEWGSLLAAFALLVWFGPRKRSTRLLLLPLVLVSIAWVLTIANLVPSEYVRSGNIALFALAALGLALGAAIWLRRGRTATATRASVAGPTWAWALVATAAAVGHVWTSLRTALPMDVGFASHLGALLVRDGFPVYGNTTDLSGVVTHGDTYGPIAYWAYVPATFVSEAIRDVAIGSNVAYGLIVAVIMLLVGRAHADLKVGLWAAATWLVCPFVALGVAIGNNDVIVAVAMALLVAVLHRPAWRGAMLALAACTKFLPAFAFLTILRVGREPRSALRRSLLAFVGATAVLFFVALRGIDALDEFWERAVLFQLDRDSIASLWGLAGIEPARHVASIAAILVSAWAFRASRRDNGRTALASLSAVFALLLIGLPQYWGTYATWLVPTVLALVFWDPTRGVVDGELDEQVSAHAPDDEARTFDDARRSPEFSLATDRS